MTDREILTRFLGGAAEFRAYVEHEVLPAAQRLAETDHGDIGWVKDNLLYLVHDLNTMGSLAIIERDLGKLLA